MRKARFFIQTLPAWSPANVAARTVLQRVLAVLCAAGSVTAAMVATGGSPAVAATRSTTVAVPMSIDCAHLSDSASTYAAAHGYCAGTATRTANAVSPANQVAGNCGTSYIYIDNYGGGNAHFRWGFNSSAGVVIYRNLQVNWYNDRWGNWGGWPDYSVMAGSGYGNAQTIETGSGTVEADLTGVVTLWWGGTCTLLVPTAATAIS